MHARIQNHLNKPIPVSRVSKNSRNPDVKQIPGKGKSKSYDLGPTESLVIIYAPKNGDVDKEIVYLKELDGHISFHYKNGDPSPEPEIGGEKRKLITCHNSGTWTLAILGGKPWDTEHHHTNVEIGDHK